MVVEWSEANKYSSFNSMKGLTYYEQYKNIVDWLDGKAKLGPPVECNLDPIAACNVSCYFCITQHYLKHHKDEIGPMKMLPTDYMYRLVDYLADWGVKGLCISGGGEPTLHRGVPGLLQYAVGKGMKTAMFTNGTKMNEVLADAMFACQFISISINAADPRTYKAIMGVDFFDRVNANINILVRRKGSSKTFLCARMLILPENYQQIHQVCKWAKDIGLSGFNVRPVDFERSDIEGHKKLDLPIGVIQEEFAKCHEEETADFKVFTVTHKFDPKLHVIHDFNECLAPPLLIPILQDGNAYLCVDKKMEKEYRLGPAYPNPERILDWWGGDRHRQMMKMQDISRCSRCTFGQYNRQIEYVARNDSIMRSFP